MSIWAPSEEGPGSVESWLDLVLVMTPFWAEIIIFAWFYKGFGVSEVPQNGPPLQKRKDFKGFLHYGVVPIQPES